MSIQGECPICKSDNLEYGALELEDDSCYFPRTCSDCGAQGEEWYAMDFIGQENVRGESKEDDEDEIDLILNPILQCL